MQIVASYPSMEHERASKATVDFFSTLHDVEAVVLYGSCARGKATRDSCLDILVIISPERLSSEKDKIEQRWTDFYESENVFAKLRRVGRYSHVDLNLIDGQFMPGPRDWTSGPDEFELEIGNTLVYSVPLFEGGDCFERLKADWLPYYDETLRLERSAMVRKYLLNNLDHIPLYVNRGLCFQAFDRLYNAFREFLQVLFISCRTYPIAYDKWIREQIEDILGMPELYGKLPSLFDVRQLESEMILHEAKALQRLFEEFVTE